MLNITRQGVYYKNNAFVPVQDGPAAGLPAPEEAKKGTMAYSILKAHNTSDSMDSLAIKFDAMASHDITYVGIIQTARASGMKEFPLPYVLTNCHNSLCAVGAQSMRTTMCSVCPLPRSTAASSSPPTRA